MNGEFQVVYRVFFSDILNSECLSILYIWFIIVFSFVLFWSKINRILSTYLLYYIIYLLSSHCFIYIFLPENEDKSLLCCLKWVILWQFLFLVGKIGCFTESSIALELFSVLGLLRGNSWWYMVNL